MPVQFLSLVFAFDVCIFFSHAKKLYQITKQPRQSKSSCVTKRALQTVLLILILMFFPNLSYFWLDSTLSRQQHKRSQDFCFGGGQTTNYM